MLGDPMQTSNKYAAVAALLVLGAVVGGGVVWYLEQKHVAAQAEAERVAALNTRANELAGFDWVQTMSMRILSDLTGLVERVRAGRGTAEQVDWQIVPVLTQAIQSASAPACFDPAREATLLAISAFANLYKVADATPAAKSNDAESGETSNESFVDLIPPVVTTIAAAKLAVQTACQEWVRA